MSNSEGQQDQVETSGADTPPLFTRLPPLTSLVAGLVGVLVIVFALKQLAPLLQPLFIAVFFFFIGAPFSKALVARGVPPILASLALLPIAIVALGGFGWIIAIQLTKLAGRLPAYGAKLIAVSRSASTWFREALPEGVEPPPALDETVAGLIRGSMSTVAEILGNAVGWATMALLVLIYLFFLSFEALTLPARLEAAFGATKAKAILDVGQRMRVAIATYVKVKTTASLLVAILSTGALFGFGIEHALLWGSVFFVGNFVPYIGSAVAVVFPVTICLIQFQSMPRAAFLGIVLMAFQIFVANFFEPRLAGRTLNLSPVLIIVSLAFWAWLWGVVGLVISIPVMVSLRLALENLESTRPLAILMKDRARPEADADS